MPFLPDSHNFVVPVTRKGAARTFHNHEIELLLASEVPPKDLRILRVRRTNSDEDIDVNFWKIVRVQPFSPGDDCLLVVTLKFEGVEFTSTVEQNAEICPESERLLRMFGEGARLHLTVQVGPKPKDCTNLFLNLNYSIHVRPRGGKGKRPDGSFEADDASFAELVLTKVTMQYVERVLSPGPDLAIRDSDVSLPKLFKFATLGVVAGATEQQSPVGVCAAALDLIDFVTSIADKSEKLGPEHAAFLGVLRQQEQGLDEDELRERLSATPEATFALTKDEVAQILEDLSALPLNGGGTEPFVQRGVDGRWRSLA